MLKVNKAKTSRLTIIRVSHDFSINDLAERAEMLEEVLLVDVGVQIGNEEAAGVLELVLLIDHLILELVLDLG